VLQANPFKYYPNGAVQSKPQKVRDKDESQLVYVIPKPLKTYHQLGHYCFAKVASNNFSTELLSIEAMIRKVTHRRGQGLSHEHLHNPEIGFNHLQ